MTTARAQFGALLTRLARTSGPQVVHGATGKDRTGWAAALLLAIADVPLDVIIQDYLLTNSVAAVGRSRRASTAHARARGTERGERRAAVSGAKRDDRSRVR